MWKRAPRWARVGAPLASFAASICLYFALDMALYTDDGDAHDRARLAGWLRAAGLVSVEQHRIAADPDLIAVTGRVPT